MNRFYGTKKRRKSNESNEKKRKKDYIFLWGTTPPLRVNEFRKTEHEKRTQPPSNENIKIDC